MKRLLAWLLCRLSAKVWVHGVVRKSTNDGAVWDFLGAYTSQSVARMHCREMNDFVFPARVNVPLDRKLKALPGVEFPMRPKGHPA